MSSTYVLYCILCVSEGIPTTCGYGWYTPRCFVFTLALIPVPAGLYVLHLMTPLHQALTIIMVAGPLPLLQRRQLQWPPVHLQQIPVSPLPPPAPSMQRYVSTLSPSCLQPTTDDTFISLFLTTIYTHQPVPHYPEHCADLPYR